MKFTIFESFKCQEIAPRTCFHVEYTPLLALKGLTSNRLEKLP